MPYGAYNCKKWPKNGQKRLFLAILSWFFLIHCTYKSSSAAKYQVLSNWAIFTNMECFKGLIIAKNGPKMVKNGLFGPSRLDSSSSTVTTSLLVLQNVWYYHTEHYLQTWSAHTCSKGLIIAKNGPKIAGNGQNSHFWSFMGHFFAMISPTKHLWGLHVWNNCSVWW